MSRAYPRQAAMRACVARGGWPPCKVAGCRNDAALGGACAELHGGAVPVPGGWVLTLHRPGDPDSDELKAFAPQLGHWQAWVMASSRWNRERALRAQHSAYPLRARAVRALLRAGRISRIVLLNHLQAQNAFFPGLELDAELRAAALKLIEYEIPWSAEQVEPIKGLIEGVCASNEALRRLLGLPVFERLPVDCAPVRAACGAWCCGTLKSSGVHAVLNR